jgi:hypothetical protein
MSNTAEDIARILKVSQQALLVSNTCLASFPKGIKNTIDLGEKIGNQLWQEAIKTELKQFTDYQTFIVLDSGGIFQQVIRIFLTKWFLMSNMI